MLIQNHFQGSEATRNKSSEIGLLGNKPNSCKSCRTNSGGHSDNETEDLTWGYHQIHPSQNLVSIWGWLAGENNIHCCIESATTKGLSALGSTSAMGALFFRMHVFLQFPPPHFFPPFLHIAAILAESVNDRLVGTDQINLKLLVCHNDERETTRPYAKFVLTGPFLARLFPIDCTYRFGGKI